MAECARSRAGELDDGADCELIARCRGGDNAAFSQLYVRHRGAAERYARSITSSPHAAADAVAEAFARLFRLLKDGRGPDVEMRPYLLRMVRNLSYDEFRRSARLHATEIESYQVQLELNRNAATNLDEQAEWVEDCAAALRAFHSLPTRWQEVLWATEVMGTSPGELVGELGTSSHNISALLYRARAGLRSAFLSEQVGPVPAGCQPYTSRLGALVRHEAGPQERRRMAKHFDCCTYCTENLDFVREEGLILKLIRPDAEVFIPPAEVA